MLPHVYNAFIQGPVNRAVNVYMYMLPHMPSYRDQLIEQLMREIVELKAKISELEEQGQADQELIGALRERQMQLEAEIQEYKEIAEQTCNVSSYHMYTIIHLIYHNNIIMF